MKAEEKSRKIYVRSERRFVEVREAVFRAYNRRCTKERKKLMAEGRCCCPKSHYYYCDCDCDHCCFCIALTETALDCAAYEAEDSYSVESELNYRQLLQLVDKLTEVYPDARTIIMLRCQGYSDREISQITFIPRRTFEYRLKAALKKLGASVEDYL